MAAVPPPDLSGYPTLMSREDTATVLGLTLKTVRTLTENGEMATVRVGRCIRVPQGVVTEWHARIWSSSGAPTPAHSA